MLPNRDDRLLSYTLARSPPIYASHHLTKYFFSILFISVLTNAISLSLEYHPIPVAGCDKSALPPIKYLQCPAAVTVRHLQRFLSSKYILSLESGTTQIDIIYEDELLPADFTLMDVAYTYNWKRVSAALYLLYINSTYITFI